MIENKKGSRDSDHAHFMGWFDHLSP